MTPQLTQAEIDAVSQNTTGPHSWSEPATTALDFGRLDRITSSQLRSIHTMHEDFVRCLSANLSAYLRTAVALNLMSLEQISYGEYLEGLASPTCLAYVDLKPYEGTAVIEISPSIVFTLVEILLGGAAKDPSVIQRKITDIEKGIMQAVLRIVLKELHEAWKNVADIRFALQMLATEPQPVHVLAPSEAVVVITVDVRVGPATGALKIAFPSIFIKRLRHKFEQTRQVPKSHPTERDQAKMARLMVEGNVKFEARLEPTRVAAAELIDLEVGDVLILGHSISRPTIGMLNGVQICTGHMVVNDGRFLLEVNQVSPGSTRERFVLTPAI
jgi:flagellar motor switch protein FliM